MRFPEAGGSASFARHAFNELVSFGAAWAQMLNYVITVAISAFFVPHYLSIFWEPLKTNPWDIIGGIAVIVVLVLLNIVGIREAASLNIFLAVVDFATQLLLVVLGFVADLQRPRAHVERALGRRADVVERRARNPGRDDRVHRHRDRVQPRGGGARPRAVDPEGDPLGRDRGVRDLLHAAARRAVGAAGVQGRERRASSRSSASRRIRAASRTTRCSGSSRTSACTARCSRPPRSTSASSPPRFSSSRRTPE